MVATGLIGGIMSPITAVCMLQSSVISDKTGALVALGKDNTIFTLNLWTAYHKCPNLNNFILLPVDVYYKLLDKCSLIRVYTVL